MKAPVKKVKITSTVETEVILTVEQLEEIVRKYLKAPAFAIIDFNVASQGYLREVRVSWEVKSEELA